MDEDALDDMPVRRNKKVSAGRRQQLQPRTEMEVMEPGTAGQGFDSPETSISGAIELPKMQTGTFQGGVPSSLEGLADGAAAATIGDHALNNPVRNSWDGETELETDRLSRGSQGVLEQAESTPAPDNVPVAAAFAKPAPAHIPTSLHGSRAISLFDDDEDTSHTKTFTGTSRRKQKQVEEASEAGGAKKHSQKYAVEKELVLDDLQEITDAGKEDISMQVAEAPKVHTSKRIQSLRELDLVGPGRLKQLMPRSGQPALDLSLLTRCLMPEHLTAEADEFWDEDLLLTEVASDLQKEREESEALQAKLEVKAA